MSRNIRFRPHPIQLEFFNRQGRDVLYIGGQPSKNIDTLVLRTLHIGDNRMKGIVKNLINDRFFGFIRGDNGLEYFFHRDDFSGNWQDLHADFQNGVVINVDFEVTRSPKGPRAGSVKRSD